MQPQAVGTRDHPACWWPTGLEFERDDHLCRRETHASQVGGPTPDSAAPAAPRPRGDPRPPTARCRRSPPTLTPHTAGRRPGPGTHLESPNDEQGVDTVCPHLRGDVLQRLPGQRARDGPGHRCGRADPAPRATPPPAPREPRDPHEPHPTGQQSWGSKAPGGVFKTKPNTAHRKGRSLGGAWTPRDS